MIDYRPAHSILVTTNHFYATTNHYDVHMTSSTNGVQGGAGASDCYVYGDDLVAVCCYSQFDASGTASVYSLLVLLLDSFPTSSRAISNVMTIVDVNN